MLGRGGWAIDRQTNITRFAVFHGGDRMLYSSGTTISTLWVTERRPDGTWSDRRLLSGTFRLRHPRLSPDGRRVAVGQRLGGSAYVTVVSLENGSSRQFAAGSATARWISWSPDGRQIAYEAGEGAASRVWCLDLATGVSRILSRRASRGYIYWYPDSRLRYQPSESADQNYSFLVPSTGEEASLLAGPSRGSLFQSSISPDGRWMAAAGNRNGVEGVAVWLINLEDQSERLLLSLTAAPIGWSEDGAWVYLSRRMKEESSIEADVNRVLRVSVRDGRIEPLVELPAGDLVYWTDVDVSPAGREIVSAITQPASDIWLTEVEAAEAVLQ